MESELFGREKGAYTGALARQIGRFELADRSSIFLDEIGELPPEVQVKLLRVLEERQIERLGSPTPIRVDTRIIAATHRDLERRIAEGAFRDDLFYRLNVFPIQVPPLRDRVEDIPLLVWRFIEEFSKAFGKRIEAIPRENMAELQRYAWPGNIRELRNVVERAMIVTIPFDYRAAMHGAVRLRHPPRRREREHALLREHELAHPMGGAAERLGLLPPRSTRIAVGTGATQRPNSPRAVHHSSSYRPLLRAGCRRRPWQIRHGDRAWLAALFASDSSACRASSSSRTKAILRPCAGMPPERVFG
jgi:transcriptional regulator with AAA-type ATPase domain